MKIIKRLLNVKFWTLLFMVSFFQAQASPYQKPKVFTDLPNEIIQYVFSFLNYEEVIKVLPVSPFFYDNIKSAKKEIIRRDLTKHGFFESNLNLRNIDLVNTISHFSKKEMATFQHLIPSYKVVILSNVVGKATFKILCQLNIDTEILTFEFANAATIPDAIEMDIQSKVGDFDFRNTQSDCPHDYLKYWTRLQSISLKNQLPHNIYDFFEKLPLLNLRSLSLVTTNPMNKKLLLNNIKISDSPHRFDNKPHIKISENIIVLGIAQSKSLQHLELLGFDINITDLKHLNNNTALKIINFTSNAYAPKMEEDFQKAMAARGVTIRFIMDPTWES